MTRGSQVDEGREGETGSRSRGRESARIQSRWGAGTEVEVEVARSRSRSRTKILQRAAKSRVDSQECRRRRGDERVEEKEGETEDGEGEKRGEDDEIMIVMTDGCYLGVVGATGRAYIIIYLPSPLDFVRFLACLFFSFPIIHLGSNLLGVQSASLTLSICFAWSLDCVLCVHLSDPPPLLQTRRVRADIIVLVSLVGPSEVR